MRKIKRLSISFLALVEYALVLLFFCIVVLSITSFVQINFLGYKVPVFFGYSYVDVLSGSMEPTIHIGDLALCKTDKDYETGDAILFWDEKSDVLVLHRIQGIDETGSFITKGDANNINDLSVVPVEHIQGKLVSVYPEMGSLLSYFFSVPGVIWLMFSSLFSYLSVSILKQLLIETEKEEA